VAREKPSVVAQQDSFLSSIKQNRDGGRTIFYTDETWANKNMSVYRNWTDGTMRTRMPVPSGTGGRLIVAHAGSRKTGLVTDAALVLIGQKGSKDYHKEMFSEVWLKWLEKTDFPKISGGILVVEKAPYHLVLTPETAPARSKLRKAELAAWLESHDVVIGGSVIVLIWRLRSDSSATQCGTSSESQCTTWNGRSGNPATQLICWVGLSHRYDNQNEAHTAKSRCGSRCNQAI